MPKKSAKKPRGPVAAMYTSPGPAYSLPSLIGNKAHDPQSMFNKAPAWRLGGKFHKNEVDCGPGPCYYPKPIGKTGRCFSMYGRPKEIKTWNTPGPGAYSVEVPKVTFKKPIKSENGSLPKKEGRPVDQVPAPNAYHPEKSWFRGDRPTVPAYSIRGRRADGGFNEDLHRTPGPGSYNVTDSNFYRKSAPRYSISGRHIMPGDSLSKPGPGAHNYERTFHKLHSAPSFSFGSRHSQYAAGFVTDADVAPL